MNFLFVWNFSWIKNQYSNPEVFITENGWSDNGELQDTGRIEYLRVHLQAVLNAILRDRCNVVAHTTWSIIDNFEWMQGYTYANFNFLNMLWLYTYSTRFSLFFF